MCCLVKTRIDPYALLRREHVSEQAPHWNQFRAFEIDHVNLQLPTALSPQVPLVLYVLQVVQRVVWRKPNPCLCQA